VRILAIDPGTSCGFAVGGAGGGFVVSGVWHLAPARGDSPGVRFLRLRKHLEETLAAYPQIGLVVYEQAHQRGGAATEVAVGIVTHIQSWCAEHGVEHAAVHSMALKKWATGSGKASKDDMRRLGERRFTLSTMADDEVDALWLLHYALELYPSPLGRAVGKA
jgi:Holliday junction resolvasome RuvABC endonuclease subunit